MTPASRDRNLGRVRGLTGAAAGIAFAACGLFAGLAASASKHVFSSAAPTTATTQAKRTLQAQTTTTAASSASSLSAASSAPVQTQQAPVASSGGS